MLYYRAVIPLGDDHGYTLYCYYTIHVMLKSGRPILESTREMRWIHCGGATGQAETIQREVGLGPGRVRGYLTITR